MTSSLPTLAYREGALHDLAQLKRLGLVSYGQYESQLTEEHYSKLLANLNDDSKVEALIRSSTCFVCQAGETIVGMAYLVASGHPGDDFQTDWAYIRMVGVDPAYQGQGIARRLMSGCIDHARQSGEKTVALHTSEMMDGARHSYESMGFKQQREVERRFGKRYWLYLLDLG